MVLQILKATKSSPFSSENHMDLHHCPAEKRVGAQYITYHHESISDLSAALCARPELAASRSASHRIDRGQKLNWKVIFRQKHGDGKVKQGKSLFQLY